MLNTRMKSHDVRYPSVLLGVASYPCHSASRADFHQAELTLIRREDPM